MPTGATCARLCKGLPTCNSLCDCIMLWKLNDFIIFPIVEWQFWVVFPIFGHTSWKWNEFIWNLTCRSDTCEAGWLKTLWPFTHHGHAVVRPWKVLHHKPHVWWCIPILGPYHCQDWIPRNSTWNTEKDFKKWWFTDFLVVKGVTYPDMALSVRFRAYPNMVMDISPTMFSIIMI